jgi:hypothetical protein
LADFRGTSIGVAEEVAGVVWQQGDTDTLEHRVYVDQVDLRPANDSQLPAGLRPELLSAKGYERHIDLAWSPPGDPGVRGMLIERSNDGSTFLPVGLSARHLNRYSDYVGAPGATYQYRIRLQGYDGTVSEPSRVLNATTHAMSDEELLDMVQEACLRYYWEGAEELSGMALECIPGDRHMVAVGASGFGLMALVVGVERGFIPRSEAMQRFSKIISFLEHADRFHGVMPHYYQGATGHPQLFFGPDDNGGDLVETSFLFQGLLTVRQYLHEADPAERSLRDRITRLWEAVEWSWHRKAPNFPYLLWHWSPDKGWKIHHPLIGWNEVMITYLLAIASPTHPVPAEMYYSGWASQAKEAQEYRGGSDGKMYTNGNTYHGVRLAVGGFTGGPLFFTHYSYLGMDPRNLRDRFTDYFENNKAIATINLRYCRENPLKHRGYGDEGWGLTASDGPWSYSPDEPRPEGDKGKLPPTGAIASFPYLPDESMTALKTYYRQYGAWLWGEYGFRDAFNLDESWVNDLWMGLNQAPMVIMIENYRTGLLWKLFMSNPEIQIMKSRVFHH